MRATIRPYQPKDRASVGEVCILTGDSGSDATGKFTDDEILPAIYAYPYVDYAPDLAWVVEDQGQVCGYILGVADLTDFADWWRREWIPQLRFLFPDTSGWNATELNILNNSLDPQRRFPGSFPDHPAEFHIDLLPVTQGQGLGRKLVTVFASELVKRGVTRLAIGVGGRNQGAQAFYRKMGFTVLAVNGDPSEPSGYQLGLDLVPFLYRQEGQAQR